LIENFSKQQERNETDKSIDDKMDIFKKKIRKNREIHLENKRKIEEEIHKTIEISSISGINKTKEEPKIIKIEDEQEDNTKSQVEFKY